MAKRIFTVFFVSVLSLGYLSVGVSPSGERKLASCADPLAETNILPLPGGLFGEIKDEALRKSTMDFYLFLSKVEMQALAGRQAIQSMYGLSSPAAVSVLPTLTPFDPKASQFATGHLWGNIQGNHVPSNFTVGSSLPSLTVPPYTIGYTAQNVAASPVKGISFGVTNATNHKVGAF